MRKRFSVAWLIMPLLSLGIADAGASTLDVARSFLADTERAMEKMDAGMMAKRSRDVDQDFVAMMVPHHQGAIDMAVAEILYGHDAQLKRIAQEIIVDQQQEIAAMRLALGQPLPPSVAAPTQAVANHPGMHAGQEH